MKIAAVVVTYNRLGLLKECVTSLRNQTRKIDEIIVINNYSSDGTLEWLKAQNDLTMITQPNSGSAGGQYTGIKTAYEKGHDWIWCMDDDGYAETNALERLCFEIKDKFIVLNCLVLSNKNNNELAFDLFDEVEKYNYEKYDEVVKKGIINTVSFFNGTLINRQVVSTVGFPLPELFIRGDEVNYFQRIKKQDYKFQTITKSIFYHPKPQIIRIKTKYFSHYFEVIEAKKRFFRERNLVCNMLKFRNFPLKTFIKIFFLDFFCIIYFQHSFKIFWSNLKGIIYGFYMYEKH